MEHLPYNILFEIIKDMSYPEISTLCSPSRMLNARICENEDFWRDKYYHIFGPPVRYYDSWKETYYRRYYTQIWVIHKNWVGECSYLLIDSPSLPKQIVSVSDDIMLLDNFGDVWGLGKNYFKQINPSKEHIETFEKHPYLRNIVQIAMSGHSSLALDSEGQVFGLGSNSYGQLGPNHKFPDLGLDIISLDPIIRTHMGRVGSIEINSEASYEDFGLDPETLDMISSLIDAKRRKIWEERGKIVQIAAGGKFSLFMSENGKVLILGKAMGENNRRAKVIFDHGAKMIAAGDDNGLILDDDGHVWAFGDIYENYAGANNKIFQITELNNIVQIAVSEHNNVFLDTDGQVWFFGGGHELVDDLGIESMSPDCFPVKLNLEFKAKTISVRSQVLTIIDEDNQPHSYGDIILDDKFLSEYMTVPIRAIASRINIEGLVLIEMENMFVPFFRVSKWIDNRQIINYMERPDLSEITGSPNTILEIRTIEGTFLTEVKFNPETREIIPIHWE